MHQNDFPMGRIGVLLTGVVIGLSALFIGASSNQSRSLFSFLSPPPPEWVSAFGSEPVERLWYVSNIFELRRKVAVLEAKVNPPVDLKQAKPADPNTAKPKVK